MINTTELLAALTQGARALSETARFTEGVQQLLARIGETTGASRVWVFQLIDLQDDAIIQDYVFEWAAEPRFRQLTQRRFRFFATLFDDPQFLTLVDQRRRGQRQSTVTAELPPGSLRDNLESQSILSMATVPILVNGQWWGTLGIDDCERAVDWEGPGLDALGLAAELIASGIYRQQLSSRSSQLELFHKVTDCGVWELDLVSGDPWCSQGLRRRLGYPETYPHVPLRRLLEGILEADRAALFRQLRQALHDRSSHCRQDARVRTAGGEYAWSEIVADITYDEQARPLSIAGLLIDISQRKRQEEQALIASHHDALTGLLNRRGLDRRFAELAPRDPTDDRAPHLLLLDIDHFKPVNDRHGHPAGDQLLRLLTRRLRQQLRQEDALARIGGEEFAILTTAMTTAQARDLAERIRRAIAGHPFTLSVPDTKTPLTLSITLSIGLVVLPAVTDPHGCQADAVARADRALYAAKHHGRNRVVVADACPTEGSAAPPPQVLDESHPGQHQRAGRQPDRQIEQ
ncbi:diguanylate cyclase [Modicisalibacter tunisiensis]|uniref:sensor domain-containing diguanylate cyclase n=1 Tax=Modicisalibacter tunisiensis TaxID=390637 RepID=UPI001CC9DDEA|nr:diguanylate cyclase [Modicisalibacter tunisiensis]MBZ9538886.1 diguanylate cyclase [Modicisalibacter tunisiensis]